MTSETPALSMLLGELRAEVRGLRADIQHMETRQEARQADAAEKRAVMHARIDLLAREIGSLSHTLESVKASQDEEVLPTIHQVQKWKHAGMGVTATIGAMGLSLGGLVTAFWGKIAAAFGIAS